MRSNKTSSFGTRGGEPGLTNRGALETVQIAIREIARSGGGRQKGVDYLGYSCIAETRRRHKSEEK
jgi:hypothetical protein